MLWLVEDYARVKLESMVLDAVRKVLAEWGLPNLTLPTRPPAKKPNLTLVADNEQTVSPAESLQSHPVDPHSKK
jgi:hypothetical protein